MTKEQILHLLENRRLELQGALALAYLHHRDEALTEHIRLLDMCEIIASRRDIQQQFVVAMGGSLIASTKVPASMLTAVGRGLVAEFISLFGRVNQLPVAEQMAVRDDLQSKVEDLVLPVSEAVKQ